MLSTYPRTSVFVDGFNFTYPKNHSAYVEDTLDAYLKRFGSTRESNGSFVIPSSGLLRSSKRHLVGSYHVNGQFCSYLRDYGALDEFYGVIYSLEDYRITRADLTVDVSCHAPDYLDILDTMLLNGEIRFPDGKVATHNGRPVEYTEAKERSGGLYYNKRTAERCGKIYDKAKERLDKVGKLIAPTLRIEQTLSNKLGLTIADLKNPAAIYYHHLPPVLMDKPPDVPEWEPYALENGFKVDRQLLTNGQRIKRLLDTMRPALLAASELIISDANPDVLRAYFNSQIDQIMGEQHAH